MYLLKNNYLSNIALLVICQIVSRYNRDTNKQKGGVNMTEEEIWQLIDDGETAELECKQAEGGLPKDMWSTYSAFANTNGGIILLGVREDKKSGIFTPQNVDTNKLMKEFWDNINNPQKISCNILNNEDVTSVTVGDERNTGTDLVFP